MSNEKPAVTTQSAAIKTRLTFVGIIILTAFFLMIAWPNLPSSFPGSGFFNNYYPRLGLDLQGGTHLLYEADMSEVATDEHQSALEGARDVIERRVNTLGVSEPLVQTTQQGDASRIIVELAGVTDVNQAINLIGETPLLEFRELVEVTNNTEPTSDEISALEERNKTREQLASDVLQKIKSGESFESLAAQYSDDEANKNAGGDLGFVQRGVFTQRFEEVIFDELEVGELTEIPVQTEFGYHIVKKTDQRMSDQGVVEVRSSHILFRTEVLGGESANWVNTALSGKHLQRAQVVFAGGQSLGGQPQVQLSFNAEGAELFKQLTEKNLNKPIAIFLDGSVLSAPTVQSVITNGDAVITGQFTLEDAKILAQRLNAGALPVPIKLVSQTTIGATLGAESLSKSLFAGIIGFALVVIFMIAYYLLPGVVSVFALLIYAVISLAIFELIPVTLTLAGIAGFVLSIGMAVDANILIFERTREELKKGRGFIEAIEDGFSRAWPSIRDSNISSLITCIILYWFGSSIIRGFAVTLGIGIAVSMFTAITVTRTFLRIIVSTRIAQSHRLFGVKKRHASI